ncbi:MAG TPA: deoxyribose-phosphate aldolase [Porphyromonadaceae bacterium]|nr:deoxyribose-phosphate aldolase [Porphyromonadaceae bacterium]
MDQYEKLFSEYNLGIIDDEIKQRAEKIVSEKAKENNTLEVIMSLFGFLDFTSLKTTDNQQTALELAEAANVFGERFAMLPNVASICVYPSLVSAVRESLVAKGVHITSVAGGFPSSQTYKEVKVAEASLAVSDGADEIDIVLRVGDFLMGKYDLVSKEISSIKDAIGAKTILKVILEVGELETMQNIKKAAILAMSAGADFIKTSTGKVEKGASYESALVMCDTIKEFSAKTDKVIGFKVAGGVSTTEQAINYYTIVKETLGQTWLTNRLFRIGTSKLFENLMISLSTRNEGE